MRDKSHESLSISAMNSEEAMLVHDCLFEAENLRVSIKDMCLKNI